jgi:hypothetical protein
MSIRKRNRISAQFAPRLIAMLESPAYRVLSRAAHQVLARIEIEHAHHGGTENGKLPVTYEQFAAYGLHPKSIAPAIRELVTLGFIEITQRGCAGNADFRRPAHYRLTYRHVEGQPGDGTHEWRQIETMEQAEVLAKQARASVDRQAREIAVARIQKENSTVGFRRSLRSVSGPKKLKSPRSVSGRTVPRSVSDPTIYIWGQGLASTDDVTGERRLRQKVAS